MWKGFLGKIGRSKSYAAASSESSDVSDSTSSSYAAAVTGRYSFGNDLQSSQSSQSSQTSQSSTGSQVLSMFIVLKKLQKQELFTPFKILTITTAIVA